MMFQVGPFDAARIEKVGRRHENLDGSVDREGTQNQDGPFRSRQLARFQFGGCHCLTKSGNDAARPAWREKKSGGCNSQPGKDTNREELRVEEMENHY